MSTASEITAFMVSISGRVLVSSTLSTDYWKVSTIDGMVITTTTYVANLWKMCVTNTMGVSNYKDFPSMLALDKFPSWLSGKRIRLGTMRLRVRSLALLRGLRIQCCRELWCRLQMQLRSCIAVALT
uniref:Uncharacterized protein n=2 Tax=Sus scrofa TaxID=9823 RepID=A0A8D0Q4B3_PIG